MPGRSLVILLNILSPFAPSFSVLFQVPLADLSQDVSYALDGSKPVVGVPQTLLCRELLKLFQPLNHKTAESFTVILPCHGNETSGD